MTRALGNDPARRCVRIDEWPERDREIWRVAVGPADILASGGERARHAAGSNRAVAAGYGRWLGWLRQADLLDDGADPAARITPERVRAYLAALATYNSTATQARRLEELFIFASLADPRRDWRWIRQLRTWVRRRHKPVRDKRPRIVGAEDLVGLGHSLMRRAEVEGERPDWRRALDFRDGLALALLALRPLRRANFVGLRLGQHLVQRGQVWWLLIDGPETKTGTPIEVPWPSGLHDALAAYLRRWRHVLLERAPFCRSGLPTATDQLWISVNGRALDPQGLFDLARKRTRAAFGRGLSPHLFRDCAATSIAVEDPAHILIASQLLSHRSIATTERHYNQARSVEAARAWQATLARLRGPTNRRQPK